MSCSDIESFHLVNNAPVNSLDIHGEQLNFMYFATPSTAALWLGRKTKIFWHQSHAKKTATVRNYVPRCSPPHSLLFFAPFIPTIQIFPHPHDLPLGLWWASPPFQGKKVINPSWSLSIPLFFTTKINKYCFPGNVLLYTITAKKKSSLNFWTQSRCPESWKLHFRAPKLWKC